MENEHKEEQKETTPMEKRNKSCHVRQILEPWLLRLLCARACVFRQYEKLSRAEISPESGYCGQAFIQRQQGNEATGNRGSVGLGWHRMRGDNEMVNEVECECGIVERTSARLGKKNQDALDMAG